MSNQQTIFQRLTHLFGGSNGTQNIAPANTPPPNPNKVIDTATSKAEYDYKLAQARQQNLLNRQWHKANSDTTVNMSFAINEIKSMYRDADLMDCTPELATALDIISEECTYIPSDKSMVNVTSNSPRVKAILEDLFYNRLSIHTILPMICRSMCKYGNNFWLLNIDAKQGVLGWKQLPVHEMERLENGMNPNHTSTVGSLSNINLDKHQETQFIWVGQNEYIPYKNWQVCHFRLLYDSSLLPYGVSLFNKARMHHKKLMLAEDAMLIYRLERSIERRIFKINVGGIDSADVASYVQNIATELKRKEIVDPQTGQVDLRKSFLDVTQDYFIPVRDENAATPIETLSSAQNITSLDDIKFLQNKVFTSIRVPKSFINFEETGGDGKNLSLLDIRFARTINRIQQCLLMELNKIAVIHLYTNGFVDDLTNFTLTMNNPSNQLEQLEIECLAKKVTTMKDLVSDPGGGIPISSMMWAWKNVMKWSDRQIKQNIEELRLEAALANELEATPQIIKRTGVFDPVDNIYGDPSAKYETEMTEGEDDGGFGGDTPSGGGFGGGGFGGGFDDGDGMPQEGAEGEMEVGDAGQEEGRDVSGGEPAINIQDSLKRAIGKRLINERRKDLIASEKKTPIYDKAFFINEEMDSLKRQLEEISKEQTLTK